MKKFKQGSAAKRTLYVLLILMTIFVLSTFLWILITPFTMKSALYMFNGENHFRQKR